MDYSSAPRGAWQPRRQVVAARWLTSRRGVASAVQEVLVANRREARQLIAPAVDHLVHGRAGVDRGPYPRGPGEVVDPVLVVVAGALVPPGEVVGVQVPQRPQQSDAEAYGVNGGTVVNDDVDTAAGHILVRGECRHEI